MVGGPEKDITVDVVGLGYVGYPPVDAFTQDTRTTGYALDANKIAGINAQPDSNVIATVDPARIREADTVLIAVPALVTKAKDPDISYVVSAAETVADIAIKGQNQGGRVIRHPGILIPGLTSRENVPDTRASPVRKIVHELKESDTDIYGYDRLPSPIEIERLGAKPAALLRGIRGTVGSITVYSRHSAFASLKLDALPTNRNGEPIVVDMMGMPRGSNGRVWEGCMYCTS